MLRRACPVLAVVFLGCAQTLTVIVPAETSSPEADSSFPALDASISMRDSSIWPPPGPDSSASDAGSDRIADGGPPPQFCSTSDECIAPTSQSVVVYVSADGSDSADGLTPQTAKRTIAAGVGALRSGMPDWLLLRRGDTFDEAVGAWTLSGRSESEPMVVGGYGVDRARPVLRTRGGFGFEHASSAGFRHVRFIGLHWLAVERDPTSSDEVGIQIIGPASDIRFENCAVENYQTGFYLVSRDTPMRDIRVLRSLILDSWGAPGIVPRGTGVLVDGAAGLHIEDCVFDHNGWNENAGGGERNLAAHSMNIRSNTDAPVIANNLVLRSNSNGIRLIAPNAVLRGNVFFDNPIGISVEAPNALVESNIVLDGGDISPTEARGWGISILSEGVGATVRENLIAFGRSDQPYMMPLTERTDVTYSNNIVYEWNDGAGVSPFVANGPFVDPRSLDGYIGAGPNAEELIATLRSQTDVGSDPGLRPDMIRAFVRAGFAPRN